MVQVLDFWELAPKVRTEWHLLVSDTYEYQCDAEVYIAGWKRLEPGKVYSFYDLAYKFGMYHKDGRPWLPPVNGRDSPPIMLRYVVEVRE